MHAWQGRCLQPTSISPELWGQANHKGVTWGPESATPRYAVREVSLRLKWHLVPSNQMGVHRRCWWAWPLRLPYSPTGSRGTALGARSPSQRADLTYSVRACPGTGHGESDSLRPVGGGTQGMRWGSFPSVSSCSSPWDGPPAHPPNRHSQCICWGCHP